MMKTALDFENIGKVAVRKLRMRKHHAGQPFMINSKDLPAKQSYLEYPDHSIRIVSIASDNRSFVTISELSRDEADKIRSKFNLS
jgi:hydrogenase maturation factor HypF (carbamoyltransferase family)